MRFYQGTHDFYAGIDLHTKTMYVCVLDQDGQAVVHRNLPARPEPLLELLAPYRQDVVVAAECTFSWYWLADLCAEQQIPFVLGHALYMKAIHGGKAKNDKIDSKKIGNAHLKWAFSEATCLLMRESKKAMAIDEDRFFAGT